MLQKINRTFWTGLLSMVVFASAGLVAKNADGAAPLSKSTLSDSYTILNIGNWGYWADEDGGSAHTPSGNSGGFYPRSTAGAIYLDGFLWGGYHAGGIKVGGQSYRIGTQAGYINSAGEHVGPETDPLVRLYRVRKDYKTLTYAQVKQDVADQEEIGIGAVTNAQCQEIIDNYARDWEEWPVELGAPYKDVDSSGTFDPDVDIPGVADADQVIWFVVNDLNSGNTRFMYGSEPVGIEMQATIWGYNQPGGGLGQIVFKRARLINKSGSDMTEAYVAIMVDPDLGDYTDDLVGCDTTLSLGFSYNGDAVDDIYAEFGYAPGAVGYDFFAGPLVESPGDTAVFDLKYRPGFKNLGLTSFGYFSAGGTYSDPTQGDYKGTLEYYNLMRGYAPTDDIVNPVSYKVGNDPEAADTRYPMAGDPVTGEGDVDGQGLNPAPADRRMVLSSGPFTLADGDTQDIVLAVVGGLGDNYLSSVTQVKNNDLVAQTLFDDLFQSVPSAPPGPSVIITPLEDKLTIEWGSDLEAVKKTEEFEIAGYEFQGYNLYQLPSSGAGKDAAKLIGTFDLVDGVMTIYGNLFLSQYGEKVSVPVQFGADKGVRYSYIVDKDYLTGGRLYEGTEYYFAVTAYNYNPEPTLIEDKAMESAIVAQNVVVQEPGFGSRFAQDPGYDGYVVSHVGPSDGIVSVHVVDPKALVTADYDVTFNLDEETGNYLWGVAKDNTSLFDDAKQVTSQDDRHAPIVDGVQIIVSGPPFGIKDMFVLDQNFELLDSQIGETPTEGGFYSLGNPGGFLLSNRAGGVNLPAYARDYDRFDFWGMDDVYFDFADSSWAWDYINETIRRDTTTGDPTYVPFAVYRISFASGDTIRLFAGFWDGDGSGDWNVAGNETDGYDWETPVFGAPAYEPIYCWQGYDADGNDISYNPADHATYNVADGGSGWLGDPTVANTTWGSATGEFDYPFITATFFGLYFGVGGSELPYGNIVWFGTNKANTDNDTFSFSTEAGLASDSLEQVDAAKVNVFPNPYYGKNENATGRFENYVTFTHLPEEATIRIFTLNGSHVRTLEQPEAGASSFLDWDLTNEFDLPVASGAYIAYVDLGDLGEKVLKLFIVQRKQIIQYY